MEKIRTEKIRIDMEEAAAAMNRREGRLLTFPDGIQRLIALPQRQWQRFDILRGEWVWAGDYEAETYMLALEHCPSHHPQFESILRELFDIAVTAGWKVLHEDLRGRGNANEN